MAPADLVRTALESAPDALRDEFEHLRREAALRDAAEQVSRAKSRFLSTASHDLRQPLQALSLLNGALCRMRLDPEIREAVEQQAAAISTMSRLVHALLDISRIESGTVQPETTDFQVPPLLEALRVEFAGLAMDKGLRLCVESCAVSARTDPILTEQILRNLISNAIKYTHEGGVTVRCTREEGEAVSVEVHDTGIGMAGDQIPHIYEEFYRIEGSGRGAAGGYGLGLTIVSRLVRLLELQLEVRSEPGRGSVFTLRLPAGKDQRTAL